MVKCFGEALPGRSEQIELPLFFLPPCAPISTESPFFSPLFNALLYGLNFFGLPASPDCLYAPEVHHPFTSLRFVQRVHAYAL